MKKSYLMLVGVAIVSSLLLFGCKKDNNNNPSNYGKTPIQLLSSLVGDTTISDFNVLVSSSYGSSVYTTNTPIMPMTFLLGFQNKYSNVGSIHINNHELPFNNGTYFRQTDTVLTPNLFTGVTDNIVFKSNNENIIPSFQQNLYSPSNTRLTFNGLIDGTKVNRNGSLTINWTPDNGYAATASKGTSYIMVQGENDDNNRNRSSILQKVVQDNDGTITLSSSDLAQFSGYSSITIYYGKGYGNTQTINKKHIEFQFITFSYANLYFN